MNSKEKDEYVNQAMERMTSMEPYYCNPFDNPKELKERASDLLKRLNSLGDNTQEEKESIMRQLFGTYNKLAFPGDGFMIQLMPEATEEMAVQLEDILKELPPVTTMIKEGMTAEDILFRVTEGFSMVCENKAVVPEYKCTCSKERMEKALISIGKKELEELIEDQGEAELTCQFCDNKYHFNKKELEDLLEKAK